MKHFIVVMALLTTLSGVAVGDEMTEEAAKRQAKRYLREGLDLMAKRDFTAASEVLERARGIRPTKNNLINLANCYRAQGRYGDALKAFDRVLGEFRRKLDWELRHEIREVVAALNKRVARLDVRVNLPGAVVRVDGRALDRSPLPKPFILLPGDHVVEVSLENHDTLVREISLTPGSAATCEFDLEETRATLSIWTKEAGAAVFLDGAFVGNTPLNDVKLPKGVHGVTVKREGFRQVAQRVELSPGEEKSLRYQLEPERKRRPRPVIGPVSMSGTYRSATR